MIINSDFLNYSMNWPNLIEEVKKLGEKIKYQPDIVVGVARGGVVPATFLANQLNVQNMFVLKVERKGKKRKIAAEVLTDLTNKKILLVEDMLETGNGMLTAKKYFERKGAIVKTACLYIMPKTKIRPDYFLKVINNVEEFPWEQKSLEEFCPVLTTEYGGVRYDWFKVYYG